MPLQAGDQLVAFDGKPGSVVLEQAAVDHKARCQTTAGLLAGT
jgi:hypothetical protein